MIWNRKNSLKLLFEKLHKEESRMAKDNTNKSFWERFAKIYTIFMAKNDVAYDMICENLKQYIDDRKVVLDLACGTGQITFPMADKSKSWKATDYSENMVNEAKRRNREEMKCRNLSFEVQDATNLTYESDKFDVVVVANALHIMPNPNLALNEINRVLKQDGILFAPTFVYEKGYSRLLIWFMEKLGFKTYHKWKKNEFIEYVSSHGFEVLNVSMVKGKPLSECVLVCEKKKGED